MLVKAQRTKDVRSYSLGNVALGNAGNLFYTVYVLHLPVGPIWALHGMLRQILESIDSFAPDAVLFGLDDRSGSVRRDRYSMYGGYRSRRRRMRHTGGTATKRIDPSAPSSRSVVAHLPPAMPPPTIR